jgi:hypothetical protein
MPTAWSDSPITTKDEDELGRTEYAAHASRLIVDSHSWDDSIVFGLTGPWGSGKSSMLAMIAEELEATHSNWKVARFTPWATGDVTGLLGDFYASLSEALPTRRSRQVRNALGTLAQLSAPAANAIPWAGAAVASAAGSAGTALKKQTPWDKAFKTAAAELKKLNTPVLLIADDIDRLQTEELLALLKVVRLLGRFPGVHHLLAYDESTLFQALSEANLVGDDDGAAGRFMEKIVQYPLVVPPLLSTPLLARLDAGLDAALAEADRPRLNSGRLGQLVDVYRSQLATPRAIDRYLAQLRHHLPLIRTDEIDDEDVIVLTLLRTVFPTLYQQLPRWREQLISGHTDQFKSSSSGIEHETFDIGPLLAGLPKHSRADAKTLLLNLFPNLKSDGLSYGPSDRRVSDTRYFDRYFAMGIPSHDVSDVEVAKAVADTGVGRPEALESLLIQPGADRVVLVVDKGGRLTEQLDADDAGDATRLAVVKSLASVLEHIPETPSFFMSPRDSAISWANMLVTQLTDQVPAEALMDALSATANLSLRIQAIYYANRDDADVPGCLEQVITQLSDDATKFMTDHFKAQDAAPEDDGPGWLIHFLISNKQIAPLASAVSEGLAASEFTIADVAARLVSRRISYAVGARYD